MRSRSRSISSGTVWGVVWSCIPPGAAHGAARYARSVASARRRLEAGEQGARGAPAVADGGLVGGRQLRHRAAVVAVVGDERGVVAEAAGAARLGRKGARAAPLD